MTKTKILAVLSLATMGVLGSTPRIGAQQLPDEGKQGKQPSGHHHVERRAPVANVPTLNALWVDSASLSSNPVTDPGAKQTLIQDSAASGVNMLYLSVYSSTPNNAGLPMYDVNDIAALISSAHGLGMQVYAQYGDPDWPTDGCGASASPMSRLSDVNSFNTLSPSAMFDGVMLDVEPPSPVDFQALLELYQCLQQQAQTYRFGLGAAISAFWNSPVSGSNELPYQQIVDLGLNMIVVMGYRNFAGNAICPPAVGNQGDGIVCLDEAVISYANTSQSSSKILVGLETNVESPSNQVETFYSLGQAAMDAVEQSVSRQFAAATPPLKFAGFAIDNYQSSYLSGQIAGWPAINPPNGGPSKCDVNNDGFINVLDIQIEISEALGKASPANDLNDDGIVNVVDVEIDLNAVMGLGCSADNVSTSEVAPTASRTAARARETIIDLGTLADSTTRVYRIDNLGQATGESMVGKVPHAFRGDFGQMTDLGPTEKQATAQASNDLGQVVGGTVHAFLRDSGREVDLGTLGGSTSAALAINDAGEIVGLSQTFGNAAHHAFVYRAGAMTDLGTLGGPDSQANGINLRGLIVGWAMTVDGQRHAVLWNAGRIVDLNALATMVPGAVLEEATGINDMGQIAANGRAYLIALPEGFQQ